MFRKAVVARRRQHRDEGFLTTSHCYIPHVKMSKPILANAVLRLRDTAFGRAVAIFGFLGFVKIRNIAQPYKEAWFANFPTVWILTDHVSVSTCAIHG